MFCCQESKRIIYSSILVPKVLTEKKEKKDGKLVLNFCKLL